MAEEPGPVKPGNLTEIYSFRQGAKSCGKNPKDEEFINNNEFRRSEMLPDVFFLVQNIFPDNPKQK